MFSSQTTIITWLYYILPYNWISIHSLGCPLFSKHSQAKKEAKFCPACWTRLTWWLPEEWEKPNCPNRRVLFKGSPATLHTHAHISSKWQYYALPGGYCIRTYSVSEYELHISACHPDRLRGEISFLSTLSHTLVLHLLKHTHICTFKWKHC